MDQNEEQLMRMLQDLMKQKGQGDIKIGNFIIKQQDVDASLADIDIAIPRKDVHRVNTAVVLPHQYSALPILSKSQQDIVDNPISDEIVEHKLVDAIAPNDFVQDIFADAESFMNLDSMIDTPIINSSKIDSESNKSIVIQSSVHPNKHVSKQLFQKVQQVLNKFPNEQIKNEIEQALIQDFEQILNTQISVSESSISQFSKDTLTTLTDTATSDPLRTFLLSLLPSPKQQSLIINRSKIEFLFLFSQPLIQVQPNGVKKTVQQLEIVKEMQSILDIFTTVEASMRFMAYPARMDLFGEALDLNPVALHYSGHGYQEQQSQSYLLFEQTHGIAQLVSANQILLCLQKLRKPILFVFVASCHSKLVGEVFHQAGAEHVICVHTKEKIMDEACRVFVRAFYHGLIRGQQTVCSAFKAAKNQVKVEGRFPCSEENKFLLLTQNQHHCSEWKISIGQFQNLTRVSEYNFTLPGQVPNFTGRAIVMQEVLERVLQHKVVTIKGLLGIGKSVVGKQLSNYVAERLIFKDGVIFLQLSQCDALDGVTSRLSQILLPNQPIQSKMEMKQLVVTQLIHALKNLEVLLVLDNCDLILYSSDKDVFIDFLEYLISSCKCHLLLTNRNEFMNCGKVVRLEGLLADESVQLFLSTAPREVMISEVDDLMSTSDLQKFSWNDKIVFQRMAQHHLFSILEGHPQCIILAAGLLESYSIKELYNQLSYKQLIDLPIMGRISEEDKRALKVSLDLSWENLVERYEKAAIFFGVMGLLPCGASTDDLDWVWGSGWEKLAAQLVKSSLLICTKTNKTHYCLYGFIMKFAESKLDSKYYRIYQLNIISLLLRKATQLGQTIGTQYSDNSSQPIEDFLVIEQNIKCAIFREFEEVSQGDWEYEGASFNLQTQTRKRKNSDSDQKKKKKSVFEDESDNFNLPLTKENLEIMQKRYESQSNSQRSLMSQHSKLQLTNSVIDSFKFDQSSDDPGKSTRTDNPPKKRRKSISIYQATKYTISEEAELSQNEESEQSDAPSIPFMESKVYKPLYPIQEEQSQLESIDNSHQPNFIQSEQVHNIIHKSNIKFIKSQPNPIKPIDHKVVKVLENKKLKFTDEAKEELPLSKRQKIPKLKNVQRAKSGKPREEPQKQSNMKNYDEMKREKVQKLILQYCQILLLLRRYNECLKIIQWAYQYYTDNLFVANILKTGGCVYYMQKEQVKAKQAFRQAREQFIKRGCTLGVASCEAAMGYIYLQERELQQAKASFENALQLYDNLNHDFGKHFLNRWLSLVKNKISSLKNDRGRHIKEEKILIENLKQEYKKGIKFDNLIQKKHKGGIFVLRWLGDTLSIFMEVATVEDSKQKDIMSMLKIVDQNSVTKYKQKMITESNVSIDQPNTGLAKKPTQRFKTKATDDQDDDVVSKKTGISQQQQLQQQQQTLFKRDSKKKQNVMPCFRSRKQQNQ